MPITSHPLTPHHFHQCVCTLREETCPSLVTSTDRPELPLGRGPAIRSGPGTKPCSSPVVGGGCLFPSPPFPDPNGDVSGSAWEGPDLPGTSGWGERSGDDSIFQVFGVSELLPFQPLIALAPGRAAALAQGLGGGRAGSSYLEGHRSTPCEQCDACHPPPPLSPLPRVPQGMLSVRAAGPFAPGKEQ